MKKISHIILCFLTIFLLGFNFQKTSTPNTYYQVYLDDEVLGMIESKDALEDYIDKKGKEIKKELGVDKVYLPNGLQIKKVTTYKTELSSIKKIYQEIKKRRPFTVKGYQFTIKKDNKKDKIYVIKKSTFKKALESTIRVFVGKDNYKAYINETQNQIDETGSIIENIYIDEELSVKAMNISTDEKIYQDEEELSQYLLFGENPKSKTYIVKSTDTVESAAFNNKISVEEFLLANKELTGINSLLYEGQKLKVSYLNPKITVVVETHTVKDVESQFKTEERYDSNKLVGDDEIIQNG